MQRIEFCTLATEERVGARSGAEPSGVGAGERETGQGTGTSALVVIVVCPARRPRCLYPEDDGGGESGGAGPESEGQRKERKEGC